MGLLLPKSSGFKTFPCPQHDRLYIRRTSQVQCSATSRICRYQELPFFDPYIQYLCSYISFNTCKRDLSAQEIGMFLNTIVTKSGFGLLRVLDLQGVYKPMLPEILRKFLPLKYLGLRWTFLDSLPKSIGNLPYLETLDMEHTNIITLPSSIWKAKNLRHLYLNKIHFDMSLQRPSNGSLTNL